MPAATTEARRALAARVRGLYAVTPDLRDTRDLVARVDAAIRGGAAAIQYRNKAADAATRESQAHALADACRGRALYIVNDDAALAARVGADGVHVGEDDPDIGAARRAVGDRCLVGVSCYDQLARARSAVAAGADYVAFGSFHPSAVKPAARRADVALLGLARPLGVPLVAIGGITAANAAPLVAAGADALAVISDVFAHAAAADVTRAARALAAIFAAAATSAA